MQHNKHHRIRIIQALNHALNCNLSGSNRLQMKRNLHIKHIVLKLVKFLQLFLEQKKDVQLKMVSFLMLSMISVMMKAEITINKKLKLKEIHSNQCSQLRLKIRINKVNTMMRQRIAMII